MAYDVKKIATRFLVELYGNKNLDHVDEVCAEGYRGHDPLVGGYDKEGLKTAVRGYIEAFPDMKMEIAAAYTEGNVCVCRWKFSGTNEGPFLGAEPTGKKVEGEGVSILKFEDGKIVEDLEYWDSYSALKQVGLVPDLEHLAARTGGAEADRPETGR